MSINILHALCAMLLQITVFFSSTGIGAFSTAFSHSSTVIQQKEVLFQSGSNSEHIEQIQPKGQLDFWLLPLEQINRADLLFCSAYTPFAFVVFKGASAIFKQVYRQMLRFRTVFQQIFFALKRYALLLQTRQPLMRSHALYGIR